MTFDFHSARGAAAAAETVSASSEHLPDAILAVISARTGCDFSEYRLFRLRAGASYSRPPT